MEHSQIYMIIMTLLSFLLVGLTIVGFYRFGKTKNKYMKGMGIVCALGLVFIIGFQGYDLYRLELKAQANAIAVLEQEKDIQKLALAVYQYLESIKKMQKKQWDSKIAPPVALSECISAQQNATDAIIATDTLIELGDNKQ